MNVEKFLSHKSLPSNICNSDDFLARSMLQFFPTLFPENLEPCPLENQYTLQHFAESLLSLWFGSCLEDTLLSSQNAYLKPLSFPSLVCFSGSCCVVFDFSLPSSNENCLLLALFCLCSCRYLAWDTNLRSHNWTVWVKWYLNLF